MINKAKAWIIPQNVGLELTPALSYAPTLGPCPTLE